MSAGFTERGNRTEHHPRAALSVQAVAACDRFTDPALVDQTRTKESV